MCSSEGESHKLHILYAGAKRKTLGNEPEGDNHKQ